MPRLDGLKFHSGKLGSRNHHFLVSKKFLHNIQHSTQYLKMLSFKKEVLDVCNQFYTFNALVTTTLIFVDQSRDSFLVAVFWCKPVLDCFLHSHFQEVQHEMVFNVRTVLSNVDTWTKTASVVHILFRLIRIGPLKLNQGQFWSMGFGIVCFAGLARSIWFYSGSIRILNIDF